MTQSLLAVTGLLLGVSGLAVGTQHTGGEAAAVLGFGLFSLSGLVGLFHRAKEKRRALQEREP